MCDFKMWITCGKVFLISFSRSEEHTSELQSRGHLVCRLLLEKKKLGHRLISARGLAAEDADPRQPGALGQVHHAGHGDGGAGRDDELRCAPLQSFERGEPSVE